MNIRTDNSRIIDGLVSRNEKLEARIAELEANQVETVRVIQSNCYDGFGAANERLLSHMRFLTGSKL